MKDIIRARIESLRPLLKDPVSSVRIAAAESIEKLEATSSIDEILATLKTGDMGARIGAIFAMGEVGGEKLLPPLLYCAKRPEVDIRSAAVTVLGKLALPAALPVLVELLEDESTTVQGHVIAVLRKFSLTTDIIEKLRTFLNSSDGLLEAEAAMTLAVLKDSYSIDQILELLKSPHASTRQAAALALSVMPV
jgi:HEAT repeat protein